MGSGAGLQCFKGQVPTLELVPCHKKRRHLIYDNNSRLVHRKFAGQVAAFGCCRDTVLKVPSKVHSYDITQLKVAESGINGIVEGSMALV